MIVSIIGLEQKYIVFYRFYRYNRCQITRISLVINIKSQKLIVVQIELYNSEAMDIEFHVSRDPWLYPRLITMKSLTSNFMITMVIKSRISRLRIVNIEFHKLASHFFLIFYPELKNQFVNSLEKNIDPQYPYPQIEIILFSFY